MVEHHSSALRQRISSLSPAQQQLLRQQLEAKGISWDEVTGSGTSSKIARPDRLPLSPSQQQIGRAHV